MGEGRVMVPQYSMVEVDSLQPHPANPRKGNVDVIAESIMVNGFFGAVVVQRSTKRILVGNHRWLAAKKAGLSQLPAIMVDVDDEHAVKILLADNRTSDVASYDADGLSSLLREVLSQGDLLGTGWSAADLDRMVADAADLPGEVEEKELRPMERTFFLIAAPIDLHDFVARALGEIEGIDVASSQN